MGASRLSGHRLGDRDVNHYGCVDTLDPLALVIELIDGKSFLRRRRADGAMVSWRAVSKI